MVFSLCIIILVFNIYNSESRVYCQDRNALPWTPSGFSCPVTCATIRDAIQKLKIIDYKKILKEEIGKELKDEIQHDRNMRAKEMQLIYLRYIRRNIDEIIKKENGTDKEDIDNTIFKDEIIKDPKIFKNDEVKEKVKEIPDVDSKENYINESHTKFEDSKNKDLGYGCWALEKFDAVSLLMKLKKISCTRRSNFDERLLTIMTNILNQYIKSPFLFTEEITEILLEKLFGKNTDLRNNIFDVNNLLKYLRKAIRMHTHHVHENQIQLKSRHCLMTPISGCFCKAGYVENSGQCVKPTDCINDYSETKYLKRIIVNK